MKTSSAHHSPKVPHKWSPNGLVCMKCGVERRPNAKYKGRFDYHVSAGWIFHPLTPSCSSDSEVKP